MSASNKKALEYFDANFSSKFEPLSFKAIPEDSSTHSSSITLPIPPPLPLSSSKPENPSVQSCTKRYAGILYTLLASIFFSICVLIVKILSSSDYKFSSFNSSFWRYVGILFPAIPLALYFNRTTKLQNDGMSLLGSIWPIGLQNKEDRLRLYTLIGLISRGFCGGASVILRYFSLEYLTIGDTGVITYATPILVTIMAHFCLGEKCGVIPILMAILTLIGVGIITRPPFLTGEEEFNSDILIGTSLAFTSLFFASLTVIITRFIREVHFSVMMVTFGTIGMLQAFVLTESFDTFIIPASFSIILLILALMTLSFLGQLSIIRALQSEKAGPVSLLRSCDVLFGFILQFIFLGVVPDYLSIVGGLIVVGCVSVTAIRKWISTLSEDSRERRFLFFLLF